MTFPVYAVFSYRLYLTHPSEWNKNVYTHLWGQHTIFPNNPLSCVLHSIWRCPTPQAETKRASMFIVYTNVSGFPPSQEKRFTWAHLQEGKSLTGLTLAIFSKEYFLATVCFTSKFLFTRFACTYRKGKFKFGCIRLWAYNTFLKADDFITSLCMLLSTVNAM